MDVQRHKVLSLLLITPPTVDAGTFASQCDQASGQLNGSVNGTSLHLLCNQQPIKILQIQQLQLQCLITKGVLNSHHKLILL